MIVPSMLQAADIVRMATTLIAQHGERTMTHAGAQASATGITAPAALEWARIIDALAVIFAFEADQHRRAA